MSSETEALAWRVALLTADCAEARRAVMASVEASRETRAIAVRSRAALRELIAATRRSPDTPIAGPIPPRAD
jgi:hypothetical protein